MNILSKTLEIPYLLGLGMSFRFDGFRLVYLTVATIMWLCSTLISPEYFGTAPNRRRYYIFSALTYLATVGVFLSGDFYTTFCFFEIMSFTSYVYVVQTEKAEALRAGATYLAVAVIGGLVMLMGIFILYNRLGTLSYMDIKGAYEALKLQDPDASGIIYTAGILILLGFGAKAGMFPLHIWLPKAHPVAPAPASALLSGILTKSGIYGILILTLEIFYDSARFGLTVYILGIITMLTGAVLALFSIDLKRTLACSSVSQIGFILVGIGLIPLMGEESTLAVTGATLYMINHSMFKLCLFLAAGAVYMKCHMLDLNKIRGIGRRMPVMRILFLIGSLGIAGIPLFSGYVSKTLIHEAIVEFSAEAGSLTGLMKAGEWLFLLSGGMTFAYMTKIFIAVFIDKPADTGSNENFAFKPATTIAVAVPALVIMVFGLIPRLFINVIGKAVTTFNNFSLNTEQLSVLSDISIFSLENLKGACISVAFGLIIYFLIVRLLLMSMDSKGEPVYLDRWPHRLDLEELVYRPLLLIVLTNAGKYISMFFDRLVDWLLAFLSGSVFRENAVHEHPFINSIKASFTKREENRKIIASTLSYGMMFICLGLCFTLFYLLRLLFS